MLYPHIGNISYLFLIWSLSGVLESDHSCTLHNRKPLAQIKGAAIALDANHSVNPNQQGEEYVMVQAIEDAGIIAKDISYINAHGSSSKLFDITEANAIANVFGPSQCSPWVKATKSLTGHCLTAAGVVEAVASIIQMNEDFVHPNLHLANPVHDSQNFVERQAQSVPIDVALSSSFSFNGINSALIII